MNPKILVATPTFKGMKYCQDEFFKAIGALTYPNHTLLIIDNTKEIQYFEELKKIPKIKVVHNETKEEKSIFRLISSRNKILRYGIENNYDYIFMLDSDVLPPKNIIEELLKWNKDIISGLYFNYFNISGKKKLMPVAKKCLTKKEFKELKKEYPSFTSKTRENIQRFLTEEEITDGKLHEVITPSPGCMLISKKVFKKARYGKGSGGADDDIYFMKQAKNMGFIPYCYPKMKCKHLIDEKYKKNEEGNLIHSSFSDIIKK